jgi:hypothetical protein
LTVCCTDWHALSPARKAYQGVIYDFNNQHVDIVPEHFFAVRQLIVDHGWKLAFAAYLASCLLTPSLVSLVLLIGIFVIGTFLPGPWITRALPVLLVYSCVWLVIQSVYQIDFGLNLSVCLAYWRGIAVLCCAV